MSKIYDLDNSFTIVERHNSYYIKKLKPKYSGCARDISAYPFFNAERFVNAWFVYNFRAFQK